MTALNEYWHANGEMLVYDMGTQEGRRNHFHNLHFRAALLKYMFQRGEGRHIPVPDCAETCPIGSSCDLMRTNENVFLAAFLATIRDRSEWQLWHGRVAHQGNEAINEMFAKGKVLTHAVWDARRRDAYPDEPSTQLTISGRLAGWPPTRGTGARSL